MARKANGKFGTLEQVGDLLVKHKMGESLTYEEIGLIIGMSKAGVRAIECRVLKKLYEECIRRGWTIDEVRAILRRDSIGFSGRVDDTTQD